MTNDELQLPRCDTLLLAVDRSVLTITLNRPEKRNAMNSAMVRELQQVIECADAAASLRAIVVRGAGGHFCAGGDIAGMQLDGRSEQEAHAAARDFNRAFGHLVTRADAAGKVVVTLLTGSVMGGGLGLACVSDVAIADRQARFAMPETGLGIIPAQIAPFVVQRIGLAQARRLALLGERIDGAAACTLGIAHFLTDSVQAMEAKLNDVLALIRRVAPGATSVTKQLVRDVGRVEHEALLDRAADSFASALCGAEGREGTAAFLERRPPRWADDA